MSTENQQTKRKIDEVQLEVKEKLKELKKARDENVALTDQNGELAAEAKEKKRQWQEACAENASLVAEKQAILAEANDKVRKMIIGRIDRVQGVNI